MRFDPAPGWREGMESGTEGRNKKVCNFFYKTAENKKLISTFVFRKLCRLFAHPLSTFAAFSAER
jgi:hypothetical protein